MSVRPHCNACVTTILCDIAKEQKAEEVLPIDCFFTNFFSHVNRQMQLWHWQAQMGGPGQQPTHLDPMQGPQIHLVMALCQH